MKKSILSASLAVLVVSVSDVRAADIEIPVEPEVQAAFQEAWKLLPPAHQKHLEGFEVRRTPIYVVPEGSPLVVRLLSFAAHAYTKAFDKQIVVTDAGLHGEGWKAGPATRAEVRDLLAGLADGLRVPVPARPDDPALEAAWKDLVARLAEVTGVSWPAAGEPGNPAILDQMVREMVRLCLGGTRPSLAHLLVHELGHAVLDTGVGVTAWGRISGWTERETGEEADGFVGGGWAVEQPLVMLRLLLGGDRGPEAVHLVSPDATFVTPYASYDPREDFAESYRFLLTDPARLAKASPEKLLALDALGWAAAGSRAAPGPSYFPDASALPWIRDLGPGVERISGSKPPSPRPLDGSAILRGAAPLLDSLTISLTTHPAFEVPPDLPDAVAESWPPGATSFTHAGTTFHLDPVRIAAQMEKHITEYRDLEEFKVGFIGSRREDPVDELIDEKDGDLTASVLARGIDSAGDPSEPLAWATHPKVTSSPFRVSMIAVEKLRADGNLANMSQDMVRDLTPYQRSVIALRLARPGSPPPEKFLDAALALLEGPGTTFVPAARATLLRQKAALPGVADRDALLARAKAEAESIALPGLRAEALK